MSTKKMSTKSKHTRHTGRTLSLLTASLLVAGLLLGAVAAEAKGRKRGKAPAASVASGEGVVNINTATEDQLRLLPGIGPSKARAIIKYRTRTKFKATYALIRVRGIGRKTYRKLRRHLTVKGPTTLTSRPARKSDSGSGAHSGSDTSHKKSSKRRR
jgi:competence protein ComEA